MGIDVVCLVFYVIAHLLIKTKDSHFSAAQMMDEFHYYYSAYKLVHISSKQTHVITVFRHTSELINIHSFIVKPIVMKLHIYLDAGCVVIFVALFT